MFFPTSEGSLWPKGICSQLCHRSKRTCVHIGFLLIMTTFFALQPGSAAARLPPALRVLFSYYRCFRIVFLENRRPCRPARCSFSLVRLDLLIACIAAVLDKPSRRVQAVAQRALHPSGQKAVTTAHSRSENVRKHPFTWSAHARNSWPSPFVRTGLRALFEAMYCLHALRSLARVEPAAEGSGHGPSLRCPFSNSW